MEREFYKNKFYLTLLTLILIGCEAPIPVPEACLLPGQIPQQEEEGEVAQEPPRECVIPERSTDANLTINLVTQDFAEDKEVKLNDAVERILLVINSVEFQERVLNHEYQGEKTFVDNKGMSNEEIYQAILEAAETLNGEIDEEIDLDLTLYYANNSTVGYTYPNTERIWINDKFFSVNSLGKIAGNLIHEWTHKLGFEHDFRSTARRQYSVPYGVGNIIQELVDGM